MFLAETKSIRKQTKNIIGGAGEGSRNLLVDFEFSTRKQTKNVIGGAGEGSRNLLVDFGFLLLNLPATAANCG
jgi:hypothetical protein